MSKQDMDTLYLFLIPSKSKYELCCMHVHVRASMCVRIVVIVVDVVVSVSYFRKPKPLIFSPNQNKISSFVFLPTCIFNLLQLSNTYTSFSKKTVRYVSKRYIRQISVLKSPSQQ